MNKQRSNRPYRSSDSDRLTTIVATRTYI